MSYVFLLVLLPVLGQSRLLKETKKPAYKVVNTINALRKIWFAASDPFETDDNGMTPLHWVMVQQHHHEWLPIFMEHPEFRRLMTIRDKYGNTPFHIAVAEFSDPEGLVWLEKLIPYADIKEPSGSGLTPLEIAGCIRRVKKYPNRALNSAAIALLKRHGAVEGCAFSAALKSMNAQKIIEAIEAADYERITRADADGNTPLHTLVAMAAKGHDMLSVIHALMEKGATYGQKNAHGRTAIFGLRHTVEMHSKLRAAGPSAEQLQRAVSNFIALLLLFKDHVNDQDSLGYTLSMYCLQYDGCDGDHIIEKLLESQPDLTLVTRDGMSVIDMVLQKPTINYDRLELLCSAGALPNQFVFSREDYESPVSRFIYRTEKEVAIRGGADTERLEWQQCIKRLLKSGPDTYREDLEED